MCDECHIPNVVPRSRGLNQCPMFRAHGGNPIPWNQLFTSQNPAKNASVDDIPNSTFIPAEHNNPIAMKYRGFDRSPSIPFSSFDTPYASPPAVMMIPSFSREYPH